MTLVRNMVVGTILFSVVLMIMLSFDSGIRNQYDLVADNTSTLQSKVVNESILAEGSSLAQGLVQVTAPASILNFADGIFLVGTGFLKGIVEFILLPVTFITAVVTDYQLPTAIITAAFMIILFIFGFIILSSFLRNEV